MELQRSQMGWRNNYQLQEVPATLVVEGQEEEVVLWSPGAGATQWSWPPREPVLWEADHSHRAHHLGGGAAGAVQGGVPPQCSAGVAPRPSLDGSQVTREPGKCSFL